MKDKDRKEWQEIIDIRLAELRSEVMRLSGISIKDCPKCEHPVLAQYIKEVTLVPRYYHHRCLTCGTRFTYSTKEVCEVIQ